jgi:hypothetical protein
MFCNKFHGNPSSHSLVVTWVQTNVSWNYVIMAFAQRIINNGVLILPPHDFAHPSHWHYELNEIKNSGVWLYPNCIMSSTNFTKMHTTILEFSREKYRRTSPDVITHAQRIMSNGALILPPHDFVRPPRWYYGFWKFGVRDILLCFNYGISKRNHALGILGVKYGPYTENSLRQIDMKRVRRVQIAIFSIVEEGKRAKSAYKRRQSRYK